jgi:hypothetical protein
MIWDVILGVCVALFIAHILSELKDIQDKLNEIIDQVTPKIRRDYSEFEFNESEEI